MSSLSLVCWVIKGLCNTVSSYLWLGNQVCIICCKGLHQLYDTTVWNEWEVTKRMQHDWHRNIWKVTKRMKHDQGILKGESGLFLTPVLMLWGGGHIARHVWRQVIVPLDLALSFGAICAHYRYRVIRRTITNMHAWFESTWERQLTLNEIIWQAYRLMWLARWLPQQIPL